LEIGSTGIAVYFFAFVPGLHSCVWDDVFHVCSIWLGTAGVLVYLDASLRLLHRLQRGCINNSRKIGICTGVCSAPFFRYVPFSLAFDIL
jgi:hypothetical protein